MIKLQICDPTPQSACAYYRSIGVLSKLKYLDPRIQVSYVTQVSWPNLIDTEIIYFQRPIGSNHLESIKMAKDFNIKVWVDLDDFLHGLPEDNPSYKDFKIHNYLKNLEDSMTLADVVTVSTESLKKQYEKYNKNIHVVENSFNDYNYAFEKIEKTVDFIGWRGSITHLKDLECYEKAIVNISEQYPNWCWSFVGSLIYYFLTKKILNIFRMEETDIVSYNKFISQFHPAIQMVPLVFNEFNACKSNIAWIEGTYSGAACLGPNMPEWDKPGITKYFQEHDSFYYWMEKLINDISFRKKQYHESYNYIKSNLLLSYINKKRLSIVYDLTGMPLSMNTNTSIPRPLPKHTTISYSPIKFPEMVLAHKLLDGKKGLEIGAAAHNSFGLKDCLNIAPKEDEKFFHKSQIDACGEYTPIDMYGTAQALPVSSGSMDYIISSHVVEHVPDLIGAFLEWNRVLKSKGIIFMIFPKRNALPSDIGRALSSIQQFEKAHEENHTVLNDHEHIWVFSLESMLNLIVHCNKYYGLGWSIIATEETDSKIGNGHTVVCQRID